jgi:hypothetical protein
MPCCHSHHGASFGLCLSKMCSGTQVYGSMYTEVDLLTWLQCGANWGDCSETYDEAHMGKVLHNMSALVTCMRGHIEKEEELKWATPTAKAAAIAGSCAAPSGVAAGAALPAACFGAATAKLGVRGMAASGAATLVAVSDTASGFAPATAGDAGVRVDYTSAAQAVGIWYSLVAPGGAKTGATARTTASGRSTLDATATAGAARSAGGVAAAARGSTAARAASADSAKAAGGVTVTGYNKAGEVVFTSVAPECVAVGDAPCFVGWAAPSAAAGTLTSVTIAAPAGAAVVPALRAANFYPAAQPVSGDACTNGGAPGGWSSN